MSLMIVIGLSILLSSGSAADMSLKIGGQFVIGALFSVRDPPGERGGLECGLYREQYGIQRVETALMTLDNINKNEKILPGVPLGLEARDSCWSTPVSLRESIELVRDAITTTSNQDEFPVKEDPDYCRNMTVTNNNGSIVEQFQSSFNNKSAPKAPIIGVVGPGPSSAALQVQNLLQLFSIPQMGYSPTSRDLSDKSRYSTFMRVVPSDYLQAQLMLDLVRHFNWTYVSVVYTDENYGQSGIQAFRELAEKNGVCVAKDNAVLSSANDSSFDNVLKNLHSDKSANVVVCFCEGKTVRGLFNASKRLNLTGRFTFIGSDGWADRDDVVEGLNTEAAGSLSIRIYSPHIDEFDKYYFNLTPFNNTRNPWFSEFWKQRFNCNMPDFFPNETSPVATTPLPKTEMICTGKEKLSERYKQDPKMSFVIKSFWAMAYGLHNMLTEICGPSYHGNCLRNRPFNGSLFKDHLMKTRFTFREEMVEFDNRGDPPGRYEILSYKQDSNGSYYYVPIGEWKNGNLSLFGSPQNPGTQLATSVCSLPCPKGHYKNFKTGGQEKKCCWACVPCDHHEFVDEDQLSCVPCQDGQWPNKNKTGCNEIPIEYISWGDVEAVVAMSFSIMGLLATFVTCHIFIKHNNTPVVKASTRELSYLILAGMTLDHLTVFAILAKPSETSCALARLMPGISFAMMYASLFTKTNRIARILAGSKKRFPKRKLLFMSGTAQVAITCILIMVEASVAGTMLVIEPPMPRLEFPTRDRAVLTCATSPMAVLSPLAFDGLLLALCTLYAVKTRNVPENFNEAKFIGFAMYTTCVIWVAFVPIYFGSESKVVTMCMCVTLSATVTLIFLFLPKLYIIVLRPERNNRALFTTSKSIRCHIGSRVAAAIAEPPGKLPIYKLSGIDTNTSGLSSIISRRTVSTQTNQEAIEESTKTKEEPSMSQKVDIIPSENSFVSSTDPHGVGYLERLHKSSENVQLTLTCGNFLHSDTSFIKSQEVLPQCSRKSFSSRLSLLFCRSDSSLKIDNSRDKLEDWAKLDAKELMDDHRNRKSSGNESPKKISNGAINEETETFVKEDQPKVLGKKTRIFEEHNHFSSNGDPVFNITITLGTDLPDFRDHSAD